MKYLVSGVIDEAGLNTVVLAFGGSVTLTAFPGAEADAPQPAAAEATKVLHPTPRKKPVKRANGNGAAWPASGSIYDIVLQSIQAEPKTPSALREVLTAAGRSGGSLNSALGRLEKAGKVKKGDGGWLAA